MAGLYYEQFAPGQTFRHDIRRTVTETDNLLFSTLTHNPAAIHLDAEYCKTTEFGRPLVNSVFTLGLMVGVSVGDTTLGTTVGNLGWDEVRFPRPVFVGDTLHVETTVLEKRDSQSRPANGIVVFRHSAFNQRDELVATCKRTALMHRMDCPEAQGTHAPEAPAAPALEGRRQRPGGAGSAAAAGDGRP
jgi:acyl dehydratase